MWAIWRYDLRQPAAEFWEATPRQFAHLMERYQKAVDLHFGPSAMLASVYVNAHRKPNVQPVTPDDFIPSRVESKRRAEHRMATYRLNKERASGKTRSKPSDPKGK